MITTDVVKRKVLKGLALLKHWQIAPCTSATRAFSKSIILGFGFLYDLNQMLELLMWTSLFLKSLDFFLIPSWSILFILILILLIIDLSFR